MGRDESRKHLPGPALDSARKTLDHFGKNQLGPVLEKADETQCKLQGRQWSG
jgi:hypothetical protein